jgi:hypothetical protein
MNEDNQYSQPPLNEGGAPFWKIMWLCAALLPSFIGFAYAYFRNTGPSFTPLLAAVDLVCSVSGSLGLVRGMKSASTRGLLGLFLSVFFFVLNAIIVLFMGCSNVGGIGH